MPRKVKRQRDGRRKFRRVVSLQKWLKAYGKGDAGRKEREGFAQRLGTSHAYLVHVGLGLRRVSMEMAVKIDRATYGTVSVEDLHPSEDWDYLARRKRGSAAAAGGAHA